MNRTFRALGHVCLGVAVMSLSIGCDAAPSHGPAMAGEQRRSCISSERLLEELRVAVDTPLAKGIPATVDWFREDV